MSVFIDNYGLYNLQKSLISLLGPTSILINEMIVLQRIHSQTAKNYIRKEVPKVIIKQYIKKSGQRVLILYLHFILEKS